jgi:hypothetical protein
MMDNDGWCTGTSTGTGMGIVAGTYTGTGIGIGTYDIRTFHKQIFNEVDGGSDDNRR